MLGSGAQAGRKSCNGPKKVGECGRVEKKAYSFPGAARKTLEICSNFSDPR